MSRHVVIDTETTGMLSDTDGIVELAGVWRNPAGELCFSSGVCNPGVPCAPEARAAHHIQDAEILQSPPPGAVLQRVLGQAGGDSADRLYVAHNAKYDREFLKRLMPSLGIESRWICTWRCALHLWPDAPSHKNQVLRYWLDLLPEVPADLWPHRALYDAIVTESILRKMLETRSYDELVQMTTAPVLLTKVRFGKYEGQRWSDVPTDYLRWLLRQGGFDEDVVHTARHWTDARR